MSREDIHTTLEKMRKKGVWAQGILIGKWARRRIYTLALAGMFLLIGAAFLTPILLGVRATSSEQFTAAGDWPTYGYDNARDNFNAAETSMSPFLLELGSCCRRDDGFGCIEVITCVVIPVGRPITGSGKLLA